MFQMYRHSDNRGTKDQVQVGHPHLTLVYSFPVHCTSRVEFLNSVDLGHTNKTSLKVQTND